MPDGARGLDALGRDNDRMWVKGFRVQPPDAEIYYLDLDAMGLQP